MPAVPRDLTWDLSCGRGPRAPQTFAGDLRIVKKPSITAGRIVSQTKRRPGIA